MLPALEHIISSDQNGFMKNRRISTNIRRLFDLIKYADEKQLEAVILSLDFQKCFDRVSFSALTGALNYFQFGKELIRWTEILYTNFKASVQNNGHFSKRFTIEKGLHQGGPASSLFFLVCAEILAINLKSNEKILGIPVDEIIHLLSQYADDADIFLRSQQESINETLRELEEFRKQSGFKC